MDICGDSKRMVINKERELIQQEALKALEDNNYNGVFIMPTGSGKSRVLIEALKHLVSKYGYKKIWYLCNSTDLRDRDFPKEMDEWGASDLKDYVTFMCYQTAYKLKDQEIDIVLADEFDYSLSPEYHKVYVNNKFKHQILTSAFVEQGKYKLIKQIGVPIVYTKGLQEVENKGVLNKSRYYFVNFLMSDAETKQYLDLSRDIHVLMGIIDNPLSPKKQVNYAKYKIEFAIRRRKRFLNSLESSAFFCRKLMQDIYREDKSCKILTFCELTEQANNVCKYTYHMESDPTNLDRFREDEIQSLAVVGKINRGVNIKGVKYIIFESCNSSKTQLTQRLGRGKRLSNNEMLNVYFLVPCYLENGKIRYTKVRNWILDAASSLDLSGAKLYRYKS